MAEVGPNQVTTLMGIPVPMSRLCRLAVLALLGWQESGAREFASAVSSGPAWWVAIDATVRS